MNTLDGESAATGYGTAYRQPTGMGLPDYEPGRFSTTRPDIEWCDDAGCPRSECVDCRRLST